MNLVRVRGQLESKFSNVDELAEGVFRSIRRSKGKDVAAYIFDLNGKLPDTEARLSLYLDDVLGHAYFDEKASADLRWNNYLYFVLENNLENSQALVNAKIRIEADRAYARKYVICEADFDQTLEQLDSVASSPNIVANGDVIQVWANKLSNAGLQIVLDTDRTIADTVRIICSSAPKRSNRSTKVSGMDKSSLLVSSHLKNIDLSKFRTFPKKTEPIRLGRANLIFGANGVGKTSLLEGIEFLFCGANRRSSGDQYLKVNATLASGSEIATASSQVLTDFKTRQRLWYGGDDASRRNNLPNQFARFNFLNTDAAAELSILPDTDEGGVQSNTNSLAELLSGHEATLLWRRIESVCKSLMDSKRLTDAERAAQVAEKKAKELELETLELTPTQSGAAFAILTRDLKRLGWRTSIDKKEDVDRALADHLAELTSLLGVVRQLDWLDEPITMPLLEQNAKTLLQGLEKVRALNWDIEATERSRRISVSRWLELQAAEQEIREISAEAAEDLVKQTIELESVERGLGVMLKPISSLPESYSLENLAGFHELTISVAKEKIVLRLTQARISTTETARRLSEVSARQTMLADLLTQLRNLALATVEHTHSADVCPVCGSQFKAGELLSRIESLAASHSESQGLELQRQLSTLKNECENFNALEVQVDRLGAFLEALQIRSDKTLVVEAIRLASSYKAQHQDFTRLQSELKSRISSYEKNGLTLEKLIRLCSIERDENYLKEAFSLDLAAELVRIRELLQNSGEVLNALNSSIADTEDEMNEVLFQMGLNNISISDAIEIGSSRERAILAALEGCVLAKNSLEISDLTDIRDLHISLEAAILSVESVLSLLEVELLSGAKLLTLRSAISQLKASLSEKSTISLRLVNAIEALREVLENHSLDTATRDMIIATHSVADKIFGRIHSPMEYRIAPDPKEPLARRDNGGPISLAKVSTGQRAAYALSIFLAMNAQLKNGPKVLLLDDPISHIDDFNALSFLDYLRNLVIHSNRQVFFATADEKIAGLFAHKFGFLGDELHTLELSRA
ncbi:AAA family ATPase [Variovorax sp. 770b2]|uniref:AAA family ATPase n=1 Tax=Variovorax sp. 770b2 TaxID=1566271 RepID=UPI0008ECAF29|nr:AAA family ATPase [Variovorax sp. 770b2]SFP99496.1 DNA repair exonuclease SbcCD ATPase subunit [Variovorax sp. 770b2]